MRLFFICKKCGNNNTLKWTFGDRGSLQRKKGDSFELTCSSCGRKIRYEPNDIKASSYGLINALLFIVTLALTLFLGWYLFQNYWGKSFYAIVLIPLGMLIPSMLYFTYIKSENKKVQIFNSYRRRLWK